MERLLTILVVASLTLAPAITAEAPAWSDGCEFDLIGLKPKSACSITATNAGQQPTGQFQSPAATKPALKKGCVDRFCNRRAVSISRLARWIASAVSRPSRNRFS